MNLKEEPSQTDKYKLHFFCPACNKRHTNFGILPFAEKYSGLIPFGNVVCSECRSNQFIDIIKITKYELEEFFFPKKIEPNEVILGFGRHKNHSIVEIPKDYLELVLVEQTKTSIQRQYHVRFDMHTRNIVEEYLGKWYNPIEDKWISI